MLIDKSAERGATILEFALICLVLFGFVGFILDAGIIIFNYTLLGNTTATTVRAVAVTDGLLVNSPTMLKDALETKADQYLRDSFGITSSNVSFNATACRDSNNRCILRLAGTWQTHCIWCILLGGSFNVKTSSDSVFEDRCLPPSFCGGSC
ncbi:pilus assembly protein [bacterium]|nr:pilus assembly protein [bacterium]